MNARGLIAVDKMAGKVLFLNPATYETEITIDGFPRTVHELLVVPETCRAYVPIFRRRHPLPHPEPATTELRLRCQKARTE